MLRITVLNSHENRFYNIPGVKLSIYTFISIWLKQYIGTLYTVYIKFGIEKYVLVDSLKLEIMFFKTIHHNAGTFTHVGMDHLTTLQKTHLNFRIIEEVNIMFAVGV